jgi:urea transport system permease protein
LAPYWLFALGSLFIVVTLLLPKGIVGTIQHSFGEWRSKRAAAGAAAPDDSVAQAAE